MSRRVGAGRFGALALLALLGCVAAPARAQNDNGPAVPNNPFGDGLLFNSNVSGFSPPRPGASEGVWAEVIMANSKWLVLQNEQGQQFPVSTEGIRTFLIRWPMRLDEIDPEMLVQATGVYEGSNQIRTDLLDVYAGGARSLVEPSSFTNVQGFNPVISPAGFGFQNVYGDILPLVAGEYAGANRYHVVGPLLGLGPVRILGAGNVTYILLPVVPDGFTVKQVTLGSPNFARKGDLAFVTPAGTSPKTLNIAQLVLYKTIPLRQFVPR